MTKLHVTLACAVLLLPAAAAAQRGASGPPEHADVEPINDRPNPYVAIRDWGALPDGRTWGSVSAVNVDIDGVHIWAADRCGVNSCAESDLDPIVKLDADGNVVRAFGGGLIHWPHGMDVDRDGNVWVADAVSAANLGDNPTASGRGHTVIKFSPEGEVLLTLGTPGEAGDPPTHLTQPSDVQIGTDGSIFVAEAHGAQFLDEDSAADAGPPRVGRISKFAPDGTFIGSWGSWGYGDGQFRGPHSFAMDSQGRLFVADRGNRRIQIFDQEGDAPRHLVPVQPQQRHLHRRERRALRGRLRVRRQLQPRLDEGAARGQRPHGRGAVLHPGARVRAALGDGRRRFDRRRRDRRRGRQRHRRRGGPDPGTHEVRAALAAREEAREELCTS